MTYLAPVDDILFTLRHVAGLDRLIAEGLAPDIESGLAETVLAEAGRFATERIAPLNRVGDTHGARLEDGVVTMPPGWKEVYREWAAAGWNGLTADERFGGQGLPILLQTACNEMWNAASMAFALGPLLTAGAIEALQTHGSEELRRLYLPKLVSGEWTGTMNLTEPHAGSDLSALRTKAERAGDGSYRITGLPDAPAGTRGISLFLVPKRLVNADGSLGAPNDLHCHGLEHKLGIHASPTCTMVYGDGGGAVGHLVGEENRGLACMFTMMNNARLAVGVQGVAIAERAYQQARNYARERRQGRAPGASGEGMSPIVQHPDIRRMLLSMRAQTEAARAVCMLTAEALDRAARETDPERKRRAGERAALLTPVAKAWSTDIGIDVASLGIQVHGGMGYVEETGAAQHLRDARIAAIYEGTNGIQAIDLVMRKLPLSGGEAVAEAIGRMRATAERVRRANAPGFGRTAERLAAAVDALDAATAWLAATMSSKPDDALAGATPYLELFGLACGGTALAEKALADASDAGRVTVARFFAEQIAVRAPALASAVTDGAEAVNGAAEMFAA